MAILSIFNIFSSNVDKKIYQSYNFNGKYYDYKNNKNKKLIVNIVNLINLDLKFRLYVN